VEPIEKLTIDTPEQITLEYPLAGLGSRFLAFFIDTLIQGIVILIVFLIMLALLPGINMVGESGAKWLIALWIFAGFLMYWGYFAFFEAIWKGQTPGKRQVGIRVIKENGGSIGAGEAMSRNLLRAVDSLPGFYGVGILSIFLNQQNKRLGDFVAGTVVVHERAAEESQPYWNTKETGAEGIYTVPDMRPEEVEVLESFLGRRIDLDPQVRYKIGHEMANRMAARLKLAPDQRPKDEDLIEAVVRQYRKSASYR
jgi:uncharacterized RDD family membrane protein YckC